MTTLSIIIPVWNRENQIVDTLRSITSQEGIDRCCLIIVDNNSTDKSVEVINRWIGENQSLKVQFTECHIQGAAAARNAGIKLVKTPWLLQFDSDDIMLPGLIAKILSIIDTNRKVNLISWDVEEQLPNGKCKRDFGLRPSKSMRFNNLIHASLATLRYAIATSLIRHAGLWDETCLGWDDIELGTRILQHKVLPISLDKVYAEIYISSNSITESRFSTNPHKWEHALDLIEKTYIGNPTGLKWVDYRRTILAAFYARENSKENAHRLLSSVLSRQSWRMKLLLNTLYFKHRLYPRGSYILASIFLSRKF